MKVLKWIVAILVIVGALNWGLVGFFHFNLVTAILGSFPNLERIVYCLVGIAGVVAIILLAKCCCKKSCASKV